MTCLSANMIIKPRKEEILMRRQKKEIKAVIMPPKNEQTLRLFEKRMCDFYASQVEQRLRSLPKEQKLEVVDALIASTYQ